MRAKAVAFVAAAARRGASAPPAKAAIATRRVGAIACSSLPIDELLTGDCQLDAIEAGARGDVERFPVVAPAAIGGSFGGFDQAEALAVGREDPDAARTRPVDIAERDDLPAVGNAVAGLLGA